MAKQIVKYEAHNQTGLLLNANESSYNLKKEILEEVKDQLDNILFNRYPDETDQSLYEAYGKVIGVKPEQLLAGNGSDQMLGYMIGTFLGKGKKLYTLKPDFSMYDYYASSYEAEVEKYQIDEDGQFDIDDFIEAGKEKEVGLVMFSNPNNPTGHCLNNEEILKIAEGFKEIPVVIDEAYMEFAGESIVNYVSQYDNLYVTRTLSKAYGLAGIRLGFLIGNEENMKQLKEGFVPYALNSITQMVGTVVLSHAEQYQDYIEEVKENRDEMYEKLQTYQTLKVYPSKANFIYGRCANKERLLQLFNEADITIRTYSDDSFRLTIGTKEENQQVLAVLDAYEKEN